MIKRFFIIVVSMMFVFCSSGCSRNESKEGKIDKMTEKVADDALETINNPINRAKAVEGMAADRQKMLDENMGDN